MIHSNNVISDAGKKHLRLQLAADVGPVLLRKLLAHFGSLNEVLGASAARLADVNGIGSRRAAAILEARQDESVETEIARAASCGLRIVCPEDPDYPKPLLNIPDPPICLYIRGNIEPPDGVSIAIVGSRLCSHYGREQAVRFGELLGGAGFTVVSGLARGIDGHAHRGALKAGGRSIAVLGNGLASVYPPEHKPLAEQIAASGAVVSELPIDTSPLSSNFPRRNRIIVGLALGVIVIEAGRRSGALITARLASEYNREVFAVPGAIDRPEYSAGVNALIRDGGAKLVTGLEDVLEELAAVGEIMGRHSGPGDARESQQESPTVKTTVQLTRDERAVLDAIGDGLEDVDLIASANELEASRVATILTALELKGLVQRLSGNRFALSRAARHSSGVAKQG